MSSRIKVKSIVGRFLEHSRIYCFANGKEMSSESADIYLASADLMERNLDDRVEIMVPLLEATVRKQVLEQIMKANLLDQRQSWLLGQDGEWRRQLEPIEKDQLFCAQTWFTETDSYSGLGSHRHSRMIPEAKHA